MKSTYGYACVWDVHMLWWDVFAGSVHAPNSTNIPAGYDEPILHTYEQNYITSLYAACEGKGQAVFSIVALCFCVCACILVVPTISLIIHTPPFVLSTTSIPLINRGATGTFSTYLIQICPPNVPTKYAHQMYQIYSCSFKNSTMLS